MELLATFIFAFYMVKAAFIVRTKSKPKYDFDSDFAFCRKNEHLSHAQNEKSILLLNFAVPKLQNRGLYSVIGAITKSKYRQPHSRPKNKKETTKAPFHRNARPRAIPPSPDKDRGR